MLMIGTKPRTSTVQKIDRTEVQKIGQVIFPRVELKKATLRTARLRDGRVVLVNITGG